MPRNKHDHDATEKPNHGVIYLFGEIDTGTAQDLCQQIIDLNVEGEVPQIQLIINSNGGSVQAGFAIIDLMEWSQIPVYTTGIGSVASMGMLILMAGEKGHRVITPRTSLLSHRSSAWLVGSHSELIARRKEQDLVHYRIINHYIQHTHVGNEEQLSATLLRDIDTWLTPDEAIEHGIADKIQSDSKRMWPGVMTRDLSMTLEIQNGGNGR